MGGFACDEFPANLQNAAAWLMSLQAPQVDEDTVVEWLEWCRADPAHLDAFNEVERLYHQLQTAPPAAKAAFLSSTPVVETVPLVNQRKTAWMGIAAGTLLAALLVFARGFGGPPRGAAPESANYRAVRGEQPEVVLADRSRVTLGSTSEVASHYTRDMRFVDLRAGEAFFEVQRDYSRPFVVRAGGVTVTAVGTQFDVRRTSERTIVAVTEGAVDVALEGIAGAVRSNSVRGETTMPVRIRAGQQAVWSGGKPALTVSDVSPDVVKAWRSGRLEFVMEPLGSVVDDVNRYASKRIVIRDPELREFIFTGTVFMDQVNVWAATLGVAFPVSTTTAPDGSLVIERRRDK